MGLDRAAMLHEAETYYLRNRERQWPQDDQVIPALADLPVTSALEIGAGDGGRLRRLADQHGCQIEGIEASLTAVFDAEQAGVQVHLGVAPDDLYTLESGKYDVIVIGFCMYLMSRSDLFTLAAETNRLLVDDGHLVVRDFLYPRALSKTYSHDPSRRIHKGDPSAPWTWSPQYVLVKRLQEIGGQPQDWQTVDVLRKLPEGTALWD